MSLIAATCGLLAGPERLTKISTMLDIGLASDQSDILNIEGWIDPPSYTKTPPIFLNFGKDQSETSRHYTVPVDSVVVFRANEDVAPSIELMSQGVTLVEFNDQQAETSRPNTDAPHNLRRWQIKDDTQIRVHKGWRTIATIDLKILPDHPPQIELLDLRTIRSDSMMISAHISDDYGVARAMLRLRNPSPSPAHLLSPLIPLPVIQLTVPNQGRDFTSETRISVALIPRAYAGMTVEAELYAEDDAGQSGSTPPFTLSLPSKTLAAPLARAIEEQGQRLQRGSSAKEGVAENLDALMSAPDIFEPGFGTHLGMRLARRNVERSESNQSQIEAGHSLYMLADVIDESFKSDARRVLDDIRERLRQALEAKADENTIRSLLDEFSSALSAYLDDYMRRALEAKRNGGADAKKGKGVRAENLQILLDQMRERLNKGQSLEALLDRLDPLLDALEAGDASPQLSEGDPSTAAEEALDGVIRNQQGLRDETFRHSQSDDAGQLNDLQARQKALRDTLKALREEMDKQDLAGREALTDAEQSMKDAESALGESDERGALRQQEEALKSLRNGARALAEADKNSPQGQGTSGQGRKGSASRTDPFGRHQGSADSNGTWADQDRALSDHAQQILDLLREVLSRSSDLSRPLAEREYLKRLLDREPMP